MSRTSNEKVIITCAMSGVVTTRAQCAAIPYTVEEFAAEAKRAYDAGASVLHIHARSDEGAAAWICPRGLHRVHECDGLARIQLHVPVPALRCDFASKDGPESRIDIWSDPNNGQAVREPFALRWHSIITSVASLLGEADTAFVWPELTKSPAFQLGREDC